MCSVEYSVHVSFRTLLFPALQVNGPLRHVLLFHADHSAAEKPSARYRNVTATGGQRGG